MTAGIRSDEHILPEVAGGPMFHVVVTFRGSLRLQKGKEDDDLFLAYEPNLASFARLGAESF